MKQIWSPSLLLLSLLLLVACGREAGSGVPVQTGTLQLVRELGAEGSAFTFAAPVHAAGSVRGPLWVADQGADVLYRFDSLAAKPVAVGRFGAGPGEFRDPAAVLVDGDRVGVLDSGNGRFQWLGTDGAFRGSFRAEFGEQGAVLLAPGRVLLYRPGLVIRDGHAEGRRHLAYLYGDSGYSGRGFGEYRETSGDPVVGMMRNANALAVGGGRVWLAELLSARIVRYDTASAVVDTVGRPLPFAPRDFSAGFTLAGYQQQEGARTARNGDVHVGAPGKHHMADPVTLAGAGAADGCFYFLTLLDRIQGTEAAGKVAVDVISADGRLLGRHRVEGFDPGAIHVDDQGHLVLVSPQSATVRVYRPTRPLCQG